MRELSMLRSAQPNGARGIRGIENKENSCYIASVVQTLSNISELKDYLFSPKLTQDLAKNNKILKESVAYSFCLLLKRLWYEDNKGPFLPSFFRNLIKQKFGQVKKKYILFIIIVYFIPFNYILSTYPLVQ
jgi:ubiquitin C-terminal hydrolase